LALRIQPMTFQSYRSRTTVRYTQPEVVSKEYGKKDNGYNSRFICLDRFFLIQSKEADKLQNLIEHNNVNNIFICPVIYMEVLRGIREDNTFHDIKETLLNFHILNNEILEITEPPPPIQIIKCWIIRKAARQRTAPNNTNDTFVCPLT
jgi:predicted nucleic acid-binding protein